jgi:hypothetical protein
LPDLRSVARHARPDSSAGACSRRRD